MAHHTIISLVALALVAHLCIPAAQATPDTARWVCGGKQVATHVMWNDIMQQCNVLKKGFCRYLCMLQKATVLDSHLELQEDNAKEVIATSVKDPDLHEPILKAIQRCLKYTNDLDQKTDFCFGNQQFLHCLTDAVTLECGVEYDRFLYDPILVPIPAPLPPRPPVILPQVIKAPSKPPKGGMFFGSLFGK